MMIIVVEGISAAGKTTWCKSHGQSNLIPETFRDCQEFCAVGHDDEKERIITWLSRKNFWTSSWL
ncbi:hypothetical protein CN089_20780, partial [Sinorhizobium meliloti]